MEFRSNWHRTSWDQAVKTRIPEMIGEFCELSGYRIDHAGNCTINILVEDNPTGGRNEISVVFPGIPMPDERGVFWIDGKQFVVVPVAENEKLERVRCVGDLLVEFLAERLVPATNYQLANEEAVLLWLPLGKLINDFFAEAGQLLDTTNFIAETTHLRRVVVEQIHEVATRDEFGLTCPVEIPTGPNIGFVMTVASGAFIANGEIRKIDNIVTPSHLLGPTAACVPFISRSAPARIIMGVNMMRQWVPPLECEPALVRTGNEIEEAEFWCGITLFTAFMGYGRGNYEDGIVLSQSAASRMRYHDQVEIGDKLSNRHGTKGVVARILPDREMPKTESGRVVECIFSFSGLHTRMNTGELWEAIYGLLVESGNADPTVLQYAGPSRIEISSALERAGIANHGLSQMTLPDGSSTKGHVVAGPVYWGLTRHRVATKLAFSGGDRPVMVQGEMEYYALRDCGAYASILEAGSLTAEDGVSIESAVDSIRRGESPNIEGPSMKMRRLETESGYLGISVAQSGSGIGFSMIDYDSNRGSDGGNQNGDLILPEPTSHPWSSRLRVTRLVGNATAKQWPRLERSVERLRSLLDSDAPETLIESSRKALATTLTEYFNESIVHQDFIPRGKLYFSGTSVIVPGESLSTREIGLPEEMAWALFAPYVDALVGPEVTKSRNGAARDALSSVMTSRWVRINRAPTLQMTAILAFKPIMVSHRAIELHPLLCRWISGDFDGDQIAIFHPLTEGGQEDAAERLSVLGHLRRDPILVRSLVPTLESLWGLSRLSLASADVGNDQNKRFRELLGDIEYEGYLTARDLADWAEEKLAADGPEKIIDRLEQLFDLGLDVAMREGGSLDPFMRIEMELTGPGKEPQNHEEAGELFEASNRLSDAPFSTQLLLAKSGARGGIGNLVSLIHSREVGSVRTKSGQLDGCTIEEYCLLAIEARRRISEIVRSVEDRARPFNEAHSAQGYHVLARAARAIHPGFAIASAAASNEIDPVTTIDARLFMGFMPE